MKHIISLGAGVQSSCMALMAKHGEITPMPDAAIFSDVGAEPAEVYEYLEYLKTELPFPVHTVTFKNGLLEDVRNGIANEAYVTVPFFTENLSTGKTGQLRRQCTNDYKIQPIHRKIRQLIGARKGQHIKGLQVTQWMGISLDEIQRMKESRVKWMEHRFPLIELRMKRYECLNWIERNGYKKPPRSACTFCPYRSNHEWRQMKETDPKSWQQALEVDELIRKGNHGRPEKLYVHSSATPLKDVDLRTDEDKGQGTFFGAWNNECDGMCGV